LVKIKIQFSVWTGNGSGIMCCDSSGGFLSPALTHPECLAIQVPTNDPFYTRINVPRTCMNFVRSVAGVRIDCSLGFADQVALQLQQSILTKLQFLRPYF
jgi:Animal haem peroxidase